MIAQAARRRLIRATYEAKTVVAAYPSIAMPVARLRRGHGILLGPGTDIVIEGYPRSANNFSVVALELAQRRPVRVAHHTHTPAHLLAALRAGVPALMLIREPEDAVLEFLIVRPELMPRQALRGYVRFYERLLPLKERLAVGRFPEVTADFGKVIRRVNERFGTDFAEFEHTEENVRRCFEAMERHWATLTADPLTFERRVGRPSDVRDRIKDAMRSAYRDPGLSPLRARAEGLYLAFDPEAALP